MSADKICFHCLKEEWNCSCITSEVKSQGEKIKAIVEELDRSQDEMSEHIAPVIPIKKKSFWPFGK